MTNAQPATLKAVKRHHRLRTWLWIIGALIAIRIALPYILLHVVNDRLEKMPGYYGHVDDLNLALIRGAYQLELFDLQRVDSVTQKRTPFLAADLIDLSVEWKALFKGSVVGELLIERPEVHFTKEAAEPEDVAKDTADFRALLKDLMPLQINRIEAHNGSVHYLDPTSSPKVDVQMDDLEVLALNLRNSYDSTDVLLPASIKADANIYGGTFNFNMKLNPLAEDPTLDMNAEFKALQLVKVNDFMQAYANVDVNKGTFGLYTEIATKDRKFQGYVKPIIKDLDVLGKEDKKDNIMRKIWEGLVGTVGDVLTNPSKDQVATKLEFSGNLDGPRANIFYAVIDLLRNAFIQALQPALDNEVSIATVAAQEMEKQGFFKKLFDGDGKDKDSGDKDKEKNEKDRK